MKHRLNVLTNVLHRPVEIAGQSGPAVPAEGKDEEAAIAEAVMAWNGMYAQLRSA
jgi:hypothetical protein